jgi:membrane protease YdiL (CAAX protease family)
MDKSESHENFPNAFEALFLIVVLFAIEYVLVGAFYDLRNVSGIHPRDISGVITLLGNGILFSFVLKYKRLSYASLFHSSKNSVTATLATLLIPILLLVPGITLAVCAINSAMVSLFPLSRWEEAMFDQMMSNGVTSIIFVCILAPALEEMLFRGVILRSFLNQYPRPTAICISAGLFGLAHLNIYQFVVAFFGGLIFGWLYERSRSIWPCILLHSAYNSVVTFLYFTVEKTQATTMSELTTFHWIGAAMLAFAGSTMLQRFLAYRPLEK